jgi:hypothetical protein
VVYRRPGRSVRGRGEGLGLGVAGIDRGMGGSLSAFGFLLLGSVGAGGLYCHCAVRQAVAVEFNCSFGLVCCH